MSFNTAEFIDSLNMFSIRLGLDAACELPAGPVIRNVLCASSIWPEPTAKVQFRRCWNALCVNPGCVPDYTLHRI